MLYPSSWLLHQVKYTLYFVHAHAVFCYSVGTDKHFLEMLRGNVKQTIEMDGGGMGRDFWQKYRIGKELLTEKKLFMCRRVQPIWLTRGGSTPLGERCLDLHDHPQHHCHHSSHFDPLIILILMILFNIISIIRSCALRAQLPMDVPFFGITVYFTASVDSDILFRFFILEDGHMTIRSMCFLLLLLLTTL